MVQFGWKAGPEQYAPTDLLAYAVEAEKAGFESIDVSDHFQPWSEAGQAAFTWTWLGAVAAKTSRIAMGPGVTCPILRYHPSIIAQASATLSCLAPDRVYLAVGTGEALNEYAATGEWPEYDERQERLAEAVELIRALWSGQQVTHKGKYYETHKAKLYTPPASKIPLYISSLSPESATFAGQYGDGLMSVGGKQPDMYRQLLKNFEESARKAGKDPAKMPRLIELNVAYAYQDEQKAIQEMLKYWAGTFVPALFDERIYTPALSEQNGEVVGPDTVKKTCCISQNVDEHVRFVQQYADLGFDTFFIHSAGPDQKAFIEDYGRDILPKLRSQIHARVAVGSAD